MYGTFIIRSSGCVCREGWEGSECSDETPAVCIGYDCGEGHCEETNGEAVCVCPPDDFSQESPSSPCTRTCGGVECANGAQCSADGSTCVCMHGYTGRESCSQGASVPLHSVLRCISSSVFVVFIPVDPCADVDCHTPRGSCEAYDGQATCACISSTFTGSDCSTEVCTSGPQTECHNGGSCE